MQQNKASFVAYLSAWPTLPLTLCFTVCGTLFFRAHLSNFDKCFVTSVCTSTKLSDIFFIIISYNNYYKLRIVNDLQYISQNPDQWPNRVIFKE